MTWTETLAEPIRAMWTRVAEFLPSLLGALLILVAGWFVARLVRFIVHRFLRVVQLDTLTEKAGLNQALRQGHIEATPSLLVAKLFYWIVFILALVMAVNALGLPVATELLNSLLGYLPNVIAAVFILVLGFFFGSLVRGLVQTAVGPIRAVEPETIGKIAQVAVVIFSVVAALELLIPQTVINAFTQDKMGDVLPLYGAFGIVAGYAVVMLVLVRWSEKMEKK